MLERRLRSRGVAWLAVLLVVALVAPAGAVWPTATVAQETTGTVPPPGSSEEPTSPPLPAETRLELAVPATCAARATVTATARLVDASGTPVPGRRIIVERVSSSGVKALGEGLTNEYGRFSVKFTPTIRARLRARFKGDAVHAADTSPIVVVKPKVALLAPWTHDLIAYPGQRLPARGTLWPWHPTDSTATTIRCERYEDGRWVLKERYKAKIVHADSGTRYEGVVRVTSAGTWRVRAEHEDGRHARTLGPATKIRVTDWRKRYVGYKLGGFRTSTKMVAITIDDGPNFRTLDFCRVLERYGAKGTFFFTRKLLVGGYEAQAKRVYDRGHEVANHTANHKMLIGSYSTCYYEASATQPVIRRATGFDSTWIRAMGGGIDSTGMRAVVNTGQLYCNWSIDSYDSHRTYTSPSVLYRNVINSVDPGDVILIHQTHPETLQALPSICAELKRRGYEMVTLSELAARSTRR